MTVIPPDVERYLERNARPKRLPRLRGDSTLKMRAYRLARAEVDTETWWLDLGGEA